MPGPVATGRWFDFDHLSAQVGQQLGAIWPGYKLAQFEFNDDVAKKAVLFLSVFPTAYFLSAIYTEGLFFALIIASVYYARTEKWPLAGFLSMLAALTRIAGLLLLPTLIVEYLHQKGWKLKKINPNILWGMLALAGFLIYLGINYQVTGNCFTFMEIERAHWSQTIDPIGGLRGSWSWAFTATFPDNITVGSAQIAFAAFGLIVVIAGFLMRFRVSYNVYMLLTWMLSVSTSFWISVPRYVLTMFPMFLTLALFSQKRTVTITATVAFSAALCYFTWLFATGTWTF